MTGKNGLLTNAKKADDETRGASVEEIIKLWKAEKVANKLAGSGTSKTREELIDSLGSTGHKLLTPEECTKLKNGETIQIGSRNISVDDTLTLGDVYTDGMIGQKLSYSACGENNWIVFGKDKDGNILLTTEKPTTAGFEVIGTAEGWLNYEEDLKERCKVFSGTVDGMEVTARSITMDDIDYVSGFQKPAFEKFTFGDTHGWNSEANKWNSYKVNYWYPSLNPEGGSPSLSLEGGPKGSGNQLKTIKVASTSTMKISNGNSDDTKKNYWQNPNVKSAQFENNVYAYGYQGGNSFSIYVKDNEEVVEDASSMLNTEKLKYILGESNDYNYVVASRSVRVCSDSAYFYIALVYNGVAGPSYNYSCCSNASGGGDHREPTFGGMRPVVVLPSNIQVEEQEDGTYDFLEAGGNNRTDAGEPNMPGPM